MITTESGLYIGIVIMGAMIVLATAFFITKSTPKKGTARTQPLENIASEATLTKKPASQSGVMDDSKVSAFRKIKGGILKGIDALRKRSTPPDQQPIDDGPAIREQLSTRLPDLASLGLQASTLSSLTDREAPNTEPVNEQETEVNMLNAAPIELEQGLPNTEPPNKEETQVNMIDTSPVESVESTHEQPQEGLEPPEDNPQEEDKAPDNEYQEQPKTEDDVFDMFRDEMVEESDISKFAATLNNVDAHDLLEEAQSLVNNLGGSRG